MRSDPAMRWNVIQKLNNIPKHIRSSLLLAELDGFDSITGTGVYAEGNRMWDFIEKLHIHCYGAECLLRGSEEQHVVQVSVLSLVLLPDSKCRSAASALGRDGQTSRYGLRPGRRICSRRACRHQGQAAEKGVVV